MIALLRYGALSSQKNRRLSFTVKSRLNALITRRTWTRIPLIRRTALGYSLIRAFPLSSGDRLSRQTGNFSSCPQEYGRRIKNHGLSTAPSSTARTSWTSLPSWFRPTESQHSSASSAPNYSWRRMKKEGSSSNRTTWSTPSLQHLPFWSSAQKRCSHSSAWEISTTQPWLTSAGGAAKCWPFPHPMAMSPSSYSTTINSEPSMNPPETWRPPWRSKNTCQSKSQWWLERCSNSEWNTVTPSRVRRSASCLRK